MKRMYGVEMQVASGKLPGFYAQVIHKIGNDVNVFDRDQLLFVVEQEEERKKLCAILDKAHMLGDQFELLYVPSGSFSHLDDAGFVSPNEHIYLYADRVALFALNPQEGSEEDRWAALEQLREHLIGEFYGSNREHPVFVLDRNLTDLAEGIARAYRISLTWLHPGPISK